MSVQATHQKVPAKAASTVKPAAAAVHAHCQARAAHASHSEQTRFQSPYISRFAASGVLARQERRTARRDGPPHGSASSRVCACSGSSMQCAACDKKTSALRPGRDDEQASGVGKDSSVGATETCKPCMNSGTLPEREQPLSRVSRTEQESCVSRTEQEEERPRSSRVAAVTTGLCPDRSASVAAFRSAQARAMASALSAMMGRLNRLLGTRAVSLVGPGPTKVPSVAAAAVKGAAGGAAGSAACPTSKAFGGTGDLDLIFAQDAHTLTALHQPLLDMFVQLWVRRRLSDNLHIDGYASTEGGAKYNMGLSCKRAKAVQGGLMALGVPPSKLSVLAHGETTGFSTAALEPNRRAVIKRRSGAPPVITVDAIPLDNFAGRSTRLLGLREFVMLGYHAVPGIAAAERLGLRWTLVTGGGLLFGLPAVAELYRAGDTPSLVMLALQVTGGLAAGTLLAATGFVVIPPMSAVMQQQPGSNVYHHNGWASVGFRGDIFLRPTTVSFSNILFLEGTGTAVATGVMAGSNGAAHAPTSPAVGIGPGNAGTGCQIQGRDCVGNWPSTPGSFFGLPDWRGSFHWPIDWQYQVPGGAPVTFMVAHHRCATDFVGTAIIRKAGAGPFVRALGAPTVLIGACPQMP